MRDFDSVTEGKWLFVLVAESDSAVTAHALNAELTGAKKTFRLDGNFNVCSCSLAKPKYDESSDTFKFVAAVATYDQCQTLIYQLNFAGQQFRLSPAPISVIRGMHKFPVVKVRLSHHQAKFMVSCGAKNDCTLKLWNVSLQDDQEVFDVATKQLAHKDMAYSQESDFFAIATATSEIKVFKLAPPAKAAVAKELVIEKLLTIVDHKSEVVAVDMHGKLCASVAKDKLVIISRIAPAPALNSKLFSMSLDVVPSKVAVFDGDTVHFAIASESDLEVYQLTAQNRAVRVLGVQQPVDSMRFVSVKDQVMLATSSTIDKSLSLWSIEQ